MRLFVAIPLPRDLALRASEILPTTLPALRRVKPENLHITLAFLGWTPDERLDDVTSAAGDAAAEVPPFELALEGLGRFPERGRPRVVWIGIADGAPSVLRLGVGVSAGLRTRELRFDDRPLSPHLTIARVPGDASTAEGKTIVAATEGLVAPRLQFTVDEIAVVQSVLSSKGPRYTALATVPLAHR
ncbi:MAG: RNA 2',3'-cyclic phosphodiesterase [Chloroflexi bacterium]|nr:MAG: RNA 2',3'-cyclic phosphodiesterase [Chloroflexota bacterium]